MLLQAIAGSVVRPLVFFVSVAAPIAAKTSTQTAAQAAPPALQQGAAAAAPQTSRVPTQEQILLGAYGPYRANNDLLYYHLDIRVDPEKKLVSGKNTIRFRMLKDDTRIQIDLHPDLNVDKILFGATPLKYERQFRSLFI